MFICYYIICSFPKAYMMLLKIIKIRGNFSAHLLKIHYILNKLTLKTVFLMFFCNAIPFNSSVFILRDYYVTKCNKDFSFIEYNVHLLMTLNGNKRKS